MDKKNNGKVTWARDLQILIIGLKKRERQYRLTDINSDENQQHFKMIIQKEKIESQLLFWGIVCYGSKNFEWIRLFVANQLRRRGKLYFS